MTNSSGFSVRIFMPSGKPEGLRVVEKSNWSGQGLVFPRSLYGAERKRPELTRTGVYIFTNLLLCLPLMGARFFERPEVSEAGSGGEGREAPEALSIAETAEGRRIAVPARSLRIAGRDRPRSLRRSAG